MRYHFVYTMSEVVVGVAPCRFAPPGITGAIDAGEGSGAPAKSAKSVGHHKILVMMGTIRVGSTNHRRSRLTGQAFELQRDPSSSLP